MSEPEQDAGPPVANVTPGGLCHARDLRLLLTHEEHVVESGGNYYVCDPGSMMMYQRMRDEYLHTFSRATVVLRCTRAERLDPALPRMDGPGIDVAPIPDFGRPRELLRNLPRIVRNIWRAIDRADRYVVRLPGPTGALVAVMLILRWRHYAVEMAGHYEHEGDIVEFLKQRRLGPPWLIHVINAFVRFLVRRATAAGYRSRYVMTLYPTFRPERQWVFSGAQLKPEVITGPFAPEHFRARPFRLVSAGRVAVGKGYPSLVRVFDRLRRRVSVPMELEIIGDGDEMEIVRDQVRSLGLENAVSLPGRIQWGQRLFERLSRAHLFVLPSLADGMPRSVIEAMARGLPVVSTTAGGIPELVDARYLVPPGDEDALVETIVGLVNAPDRLAEMSREAFERSKPHWPATLDRAKRGFWNDVARFAR